MGFLGELGKAATSGIAGGLTGGLGGAISSGLGSIFGSLFGGKSDEEKQKEAEERAYNYQKQLMGLQNQYNQKAAAQSQQYAKEMWDYTNVENQVKHLEAAGLNPALIYGMNGGGGAGNASTSGGKMSGPGIPTGNPAEMGLRSREIDLQARRQEAEINMMNAQAAKSTAEAKKTGGVDTEEAQSRIDLNTKKAEEAMENARKLSKEGNYLEAGATLRNSLTDQADANTELIKQKTGLTEAQAQHEYVKMKNSLFEGVKIYEEARKSKADADVAEATVQAQIEKAAYINACLVAQRIKDMTQADVNETMVEKLGNDILQGWVDVANGKVKAEAYKDYVDGQIERWHDQNVNEKWGRVNESLNTVINGIDKIGGLVFKIPKVLQNITVKQ